MSRLPMTPMAQLATLKTELTEAYRMQNVLREEIKKLKAGNKPNVQVVKEKPKATKVVGDKDVPGQMAPDKPEAKKAAPRKRAPRKKK